ncbi:Hachiman antiphage defense system protein HamA [Pseudomonas putida]|uniref:Hachiman antiphage defense system protein HamA n=1 Tax=Pseudomonas putida TaxID=303 RepID=UPI003905F0B9
MSLLHLGWLRSSGHFSTMCGCAVPVFDLNHDVTDQLTMSEWARHFRRHYCSDADLVFNKPSNVSNYDYLVNIKFPSKHLRPGPSIRSGDFAEILVADYLQFLCKYEVPRTRWDRKIIANESSKGSDVVGFKWDGKNPAGNDQLLIYEIKALASENGRAQVLQSAVNDSAKDEIRIAETLNAMRQRLGDRQDLGGVMMVDRFQKYSDLPYLKKFGAAAVVSTSSFKLPNFSCTTLDKHPFKGDLEMIVIRGVSLIPLIDALYERGAHEA